MCGSGVLAAMVYFLLILSLAVVAMAIVVPGYGDILLVAIPAAIAALILCLRALAKARKSGETPILIDGSNVMYWKGGTPEFSTLLEVIGHLKAQNFAPLVVFDANAGYLLIGSYLHHASMAKKLGLSEKAVMVVSKGEPADQVLLMAARDYRAQIITNDQYRDWVETYPEIRKPGLLVRGGYNQGSLWFDDSIKEPVA